MKKFLLLALLVTLCASDGYAKKRRRRGGYRGGRGAAFTEGQSTIQVGWGFANPFKTVYKLAGTLGANVDVSGFGPISGAYEYGVAERWSVGLGGGYGDVRVESVYPDYLGDGSDWIVKEKITFANVALRGAYHLSKNAKKFDPYIGLGLLYFKFDFSQEDNSDIFEPTTLTIPGAFGASGFIGFRYYFTDNIGAYSELGYLAGSLAQVGLIIKF